MGPNASSFTCSEFDCLRLAATQTWASTLERTYHIDVDIVDLARLEAGRRYKDLESRATKFLPVPTLEEMRAAILAWATWQALELQVSRPIIGPMGMHNFIQDLEQTLERLTTPAIEDQFIL
jgi:hypothetical protein